MLIEISRRRAPFTMLDSIKMYGSICRAGHQKILDNTACKADPYGSTKTKMKLILVVLVGFFLPYGSTKTKIHFLYRIFVPE